MPDAETLTHTTCTIRQVQWDRPSLPCDRCQAPARRGGTATRTAIDIDLDGPVLLLVTVSVHRCASCRHAFRAQPPFLRPDAIYTNRVVTKAVRSVYQDGMAIRRVATRLARDCWVQPSEGMIRQWCKGYSAGLDFATDYLPWVAAGFSGILCVGEVYQGRSAVLLAVDPAAPEGDRLVGYELFHGSVDQEEVATFLTRLRAAGIAPDEIITDGSPRYPGALAQAWPAAAHQLCPFHETRRVTSAVNQIIKDVRAALPAQPARRASDLRGRPRACPPADVEQDPAARSWRERQALRGAKLAQVHQLHRQGRSRRQIARLLGISPTTVCKWLREEPPAASPEAEAALIAPALAHEGETLPPPPAPWTSWDEIRQARHALTAARYLLLRRPDHLSPEEQGQIDALLAGPLGERLRVARACLLEWYAIWRDERGQRRDRDDARARHRRWHEHPTYREILPLARVQRQLGPAHFERLSHFLDDPTWEATNNGAERTARLFRHRQAPHFALRTQTAIDDALNVGAFLRKDALTTTNDTSAARCRRGRPRHTQEVLSAVA
ncbi:MAG: helix-turn-helix domain-containing protein [Actinomycetota bacterium]|nr:helix-turn-helix domain-containing protein [Actinomycetota bacterium]